MAKYPSGMASGALTFKPDRDDLPSFLKRLDELGETVRKTENARMRAAAFAISSRLVPSVRSAVASSPAPQAGAVAATTKAKRDRMVVVQVGGTNPKLSGWRRSAGNKRWRGSVAWGVEKGNYPGTRNEYRVGRSRGYGIGPRLEQITEDTAEEYTQVVLDIARSVGV